MYYAIGASVSSLHRESTDSLIACQNDSYDGTFRGVPDWLNTSLHNSVPEWLETSQCAKMAQYSRWLNIPLHTSMPEWLITSLQDGMPEWLITSIISCQMAQDFFACQNGSILLYVPEWLYIPLSLHIIAC